MGLFQSLFPHKGQNPAQYFQYLFLFINLTQRKKNLLTLLSWAFKRFFLKRLGLFIGGLYLLSPLTLASVSPARVSSEGPRGCPVPPLCFTPSGFPSAVSDNSYLSSTFTDSVFWSSNSILCHHNATVNSSTASFFSLWPFFLLCGSPLMPPCLSGHSLRLVSQFSLEFAF